MNEPIFQLLARSGRARAGVVHLAHGDVPTPIFMPVGTTTTRTLESASAADADGLIRPGSGRTRLFIRPGHRFRAVDALVTNFHLPRSTLLVLVAAFGGTERVLAAYREAVECGYRFFSYGDAMFLSRR